jgi:hypothetical protein
MIRKSMPSGFDPMGGYRFSEKIMLKQKLEHDPEKWTPVFRKDHAQTKTWSAMLIEPQLVPLQR